MLPEMPGTYALVLACSASVRLRIGRLGEMPLRPGSYIYAGSAFGPGGLRARVRHHLHAAARPHWHLDYLRAHARVSRVWFRAGARCEHEWAAALKAMRGAVVPLAGFGSSDCGCEAHLYWFEECPAAGALRRALAGAGDLVCESTPAGLDPPSEAV